MWQGSSDMVAAPRARHAFQRLSRRSLSTVSAHAQRLRLRRNATRSTGPRTRAGKSKVATNALRHGLAVPTGALPQFETKVTDLARRIAGAGASPGSLAAARRVAEAQIDLKRVRTAKALILNGSIRARPSPKDVLRLVRLAGRVLNGHVDADTAMEAQERLAHYRGVSVGPKSLTATITESTNELLKLDRYERRALSRRKFALRDLLAFPAHDQGIAGD